MIVNASERNAPVQKRSTSFPFINTSEVAMLTMPVFTRSLVRFCFTLALFLPTHLFAQRGSFIGTIGKKLGVYMSLTTNNGKVSGEYLYTKNGTSIALIGTATPKGEVMLEEFAEQGKKTGTFVGKFTTSGAFSGSWTSPDGKKTFPCSLKSVPTPIAWDGISGSYERFGTDRATLDVQIKNLQSESLGSVRIQGTAFWVSQTQKDNIHTGEVCGVAALRGSTITYKAKPEEEPCGFTITITNDEMIVSEEIGSCGGMNVRFAGTYKRVGLPPKRWEVCEGMR
jgi:hypothetical protein